MRFIIYGAGGVGCVIGAQLHKAGHPVVLIARGAHLAALHKDGLDYATPFGREQLAVPAVGHPDELTLRDDDVVLVTCKSQHTGQVLDDLRRAHGDAMPVVCCQNGVVNERMALRRFARVYAMLVYLPAQLVEPGRVQCHARLRAGVLDVGRYPGGTDALCDAIAARLEAVNFSVRPDPTVMRLKYAKLLMNLGNAVDALIPRDADVGAIRDRLRAEGRACLEAAGIDCASADEVKARRAGVFESGTIPGVERVGGSSRQSLLRGTGDIEADYLNGEIALLGRLHGVPTPANIVLQRLAVDAAARRTSPGRLTVDAVLQMIEREH